MNKIEFVRKRDGELILFEKNKIVGAITKAFGVSGEGNKMMAQKLTETIIEDITRVYLETPPSVEEIQDFVEATLIENDYIKTAKQYIIYRNTRAAIRQQRKIV